MVFQVCLKKIPKQLRFRIFRKRSRALLTNPEKEVLGIT